MQNIASSDHRETTPWEELVAQSSRGRAAGVASEHVAGKRILISGAGGSIGSALAQAGWASEPAGLVVLDTSENGLYQIDRSLREMGSREHVPVLGSVFDEEIVLETLKRYRPEIIFHAAALKHVPLMERNAFAAIENNALGTFTLARAAVHHGVEQMVLVSTDKAVDPASIMGASKRIAELVTLALGSAGTRMTAVRLCNVVGSQGSVLPLFLEQIARGGPLTVTHRDACRYFISIDCAVGALFAALSSQSDASILMADPGSQLRILGLAEYLIRTHESRAAIEFTGLRPGDKLSERLLSSRERLAANGIGGAAGLQAIEGPAASASAVQDALQTLMDAVRTRDFAELLRGVFALVPEYQPSEVIHAALAGAGSEEFATVMHA